MRSRKGLHAFLYQPICPTQHSSTTHTPPRKAAYPPKRVLIEVETRCIDLDAEEGHGADADADEVERAGRRGERVEAGRKGDSRSWFDCSYVSVSLHVRLGIVDTHL